MNINDLLKASARPPLDFDRINSAALSNLPAILRRWLPDGKQNKKGEFLARNPRRADRHAGSFSINTRTGKWFDFASADKGGDPISLAAFLSGQSQYEAAAELANMLGIDDPIRKTNGRNV